MPRRIDLDRKAINSGDEVTLDNIVRTVDQNSVIDRIAYDQAAENGIARGNLQ
jgi:hypothetical protein